MKGLNTLGMLDAIRAHPQTMEELFVCSNEKLKLEDIKFDVVYSTPGSNRYRKESATHAMWLDYLEDVEGRQIYLS